MRAEYALSAARDGEWERSTQARGSVAHGVGRGALWGCGGGGDGGGKCAKSGMGKQRRTMQAVGQGS